ncbi:hypothetical protein Tco_0488112 [Tanacetum coccineum]
MIVHPLGMMTHLFPGTRLEPRSDKESLEVEIVQKKEEETIEDTEVELDKDTPMVDVTNIVIHGRYGTYLHISRKGSVPSRTFSDQLAISSLMFMVDSGRKRTKESGEILISLKSILIETWGYMSGHILYVHPAQVQSSSIPEQQHQLYLAMKADPLVYNKQRISNLDDPHDDAHHEGENSAKRQKTLKYEAYVSGESCFSLSIGKLIPISKLTQDVMEEISLIIDEAKLKKMADEMLRQRCPEKIVLSLHKFLAIVFNDDDIEERTSRWVNKCIKKCNPYARYEIVVRRANDCIVSITEPDYKNLNKNDIEDMYLLIMNNKVPNYANTGLLWSLSVFIRSSVIWERVHDFQLGIKSYQQKINLTAPTITFPGIEEYDVFSIDHISPFEAVHGIIYTNSKKEKRVMRHSEIHKFCDATLRRMLEGLKRFL